MWHIKYTRTHTRECECERRKPEIYPKKNKTYKFHSVKDNDRGRRRKTNIQRRRRRKQRSKRRIEIFRYTIEKVPEKSHSGGRESHFLNFHCQSLCRFSSFIRSLVRARSYRWLWSFILKYSSVKSSFRACVWVRVYFCVLSLCVCAHWIFFCLCLVASRDILRFDSACKCERTRTPHSYPSHFLC